jgi:hypothetical protein
MAELLKFSPEDVDLAVATRAHAGTSMTPEVRGQSYVQGYVQDMEALVARFAPFATEANRDQLAADLEAYRVKYLTLMNRYLYSHSAVMSTLVTGPAKFPTARNQKRSDWADTHRNRWVEFMEKGRDRLLKRYDPREIAKAGRVVYSDDPEALAKVQEKLEKLTRKQELMKATNAILRGKGSLEDKEKDLAALGYSPMQTASLFEPDCFGVLGYAPYQLSNNNAEIRRLKGRLVELEREAQREAVEDEAFLPGVRLEENKEDARLRLFFEDKPNDEARELLKKHGFRWAPSVGAWQRLLNANARSTLRWLKPKLAYALGVEYPLNLTGEAEATAVAWQDEDVQVGWEGEETQVCPDDEPEPVVWAEDDPVVFPVIDTVYDIELFRPSRHLGGVIFKAVYSCGLWHTQDGELIGLHRDVKRWQLAVVEVGEEEDDTAVEDDMKSRTAWAIHLGKVGEVDVYKGAGGRYWANDGTGARSATADELAMLEAVATDTAVEEEVPVVVEEDTAVTVEEEDTAVVKDAGRTSAEQMLASGCYFMEEEGVHWWVKDGGGVRRLTKDEVIAMHLMCMEGVLGNQPPYQSYMLAKYAGWAMDERDVKQKLAEGQSIHTSKKGRWWMQAGRLVAPINDDVWQAVLRLVKLGEIEQTWEAPAQMTLF